MNPAPANDNAPKPGRLGPLAKFAIGGLVALVVIANAVGVVIAFMGG